jgi:hypothetical protein
MKKFSSRWFLGAVLQKGEISNILIQVEKKEKEFQITCFKILHCFQKFTLLFKNLHYYWMGRRPCYDLHLLIRSYFTKCA